MLYHFPDESPEDLKQKEILYLEKQYEKASRVQEHGYRKKEPVLHSLTMEWNLRRYLGCDVTKWSWPTTSKEKVELELLPSDFLPPMWTLKPLGFVDPDTGEWVKRVVGYREIQKKREYIQYLKELEGIVDEGSDDDGDDPAAEKAKVVTINIMESEQDSEEDADDDLGKGDEAGEADAEEDEAIQKMEPYLRIARGGGPKKEAHKGGAAEPKGGKAGGGGGGKGGGAHGGGGGKGGHGGGEKKGGHVGGGGGGGGKGGHGGGGGGGGGKGDKDKHAGKHGGEKEKAGKEGDKGGKEADKGKKDDKKKEKKKEKKGEGILTKVWNYITEAVQPLFGGGGDKNAQQNKPKPKPTGPIKPENKAWGQQVSLAKYLKDMERANIKVEKEKQRNLAEIFKYHGMFRVHAARERDSEWLDLSNTDPEESGQEIESFKKPHAGWMNPAISYESQFLARTLRFYNVVTYLTGRSFWRIKADELKGHMVFTHKRMDVLMFFFTSITFWVFFSLLTISFLDITSESESHGQLGNGTTGQAGSGGGGDASKQDAASFEKKALLAKHEVEELMLSLYRIPLYVILVNLALVAIWSILVILGDGILIAHYFNCWCAALAEMETSGCLGIKRLVISYHLSFIINMIGICTLFSVNYPKHTRQVNLLLVAMIIRPFKPYLRIDSDENLLVYMIIGLILQVYIAYCAMLIKLLMAILATILKNASEMWNFKFALTFQQLATKNRGQLTRLGLNHSLLKLFTHHRILTVLLRNFGEVFSIPIMMYMVMEMGVLTLALVEWFFYKDDSNTRIEHEVVIEDATRKKITIPYYHPPAEVHITLYVMMLQLLFRFIVTTDVMARSGDSFFAGFEFVRRSGTILCHNSHQRRLIQSLEWSFSSTNPSILSANSYFAINRSSILSSFAAVAGFFSLIIQLQVQPETTNIKFNTKAECDSANMILQYGECISKDKNEEDFSIQF